MMCALICSIHSFIPSLICSKVALFTSYSSSWGSRYVPRPDGIDSTSSVSALWSQSQLVPGGRAYNTYTGCNLIICPNHLSWLLLTQPLKKQMIYYTSEHHKPKTLGTTLFIFFPVNMMLGGWHQQGALCVCQLENILLSAQQCQRLLSSLLRLKTQ